jgi:cell division septation protein DedD
MGGRDAVRRAREYDGYAVGKRLLRLAPAWLLLIAVGFALALLFFSWVGRRSGETESEAFINEATNRAPATDEGANVKGSDAKAPRAAANALAPAATEKATPAEEAMPAATPVPTPEVTSEAEVYSVQVGAFADLSQANEQVSRLRAAGFEARVVESDAATRFRLQVRSGRYATREEAAGLAARLRAAGVAGQTVIVDPEKK